MTGCRTCCKAVSEVLGELLLLVIVVLLAAAFANYSSSFIPPLKNTPQAVFTAYTNGSNYSIVHGAGEPLPFSELRLVVTYNYTYPDERVCEFRYNYTAGNVAVFTCGSEKAWLFLRQGYYNRSWSFGELMNVPRNSSRFTVISIVCGEETVAKVHFPEG